MASTGNPHVLQSPPWPVAILPEAITDHETILKITNRPEPRHSLDYSIEHDETTIFTVQGQSRKLGQPRVFRDRSGLPLFELRCQWHDSSVLRLKLPGGTEPILEAKLRVAINAPRAVVTFTNAAALPDAINSNRGHEVALEVLAQDLYNSVQTVVVENRNIAYIQRITDRRELAEGQTPPFRFRPKWVVRVAPGVDLALITVIVVIIGQQAGVDSYDGQTRID